MLAHVSNESLQLFLIFLSKDFCTALYIYMQAITSLPLPTCQSGRTVHWESSPAPVLCTAMPDWWNPQCPQIRCCRKKHKDKRDRIHSEKPFSHSLNSLYWSDFPADYTFTWRGRKTRYCMLTKMSKGYLWVLLFTSLWWTSLQSINPRKSSES